MQAAFLKAGGLAPATFTLFCTEAVALIQGLIYSLLRETFKFVVQMSSNIPNLSSL